MASLAEVLVMGSKTDSYSNMEEEYVQNDRDMSSSSWVSIEIGEPSQSGSSTLLLENAAISDQVAASEQDIHCPQNISNDKWCIANNEDQSSFLSQEEMEIPCLMKNDALAEYLPGSFTYESGQVMLLDMQCLDQQPLVSSTGLLQPAVPYGAEIMPVCSWDSQPATVDSLSKPESPGTRTYAPTAASVSPLGSKHSDVTMRKVRDDLEESAKTLNLKPNLATSLSNFPGEDPKPHNKAPKLNSGFQAVEAAQGYYPSRMVPSLSSERQVGFVRRDNHTKPRETGQAAHGYGHYGMDKNYSLHKNFEVSNELVRGPRANRSKCSSSTLTRKSNFSMFVRRDRYNKPDFQIKHEEAKFLMIKSYNEDDIHKSIKYNVWASTPNGNKKLDAAFWVAERMIRGGSKCPIFLFFSVNASGQFVGLAEMVGPVDFNKDMDFWQQEKWNGFFPVKWHIIKDIPNRLFQNITLENNDDKAVTFSKDTQEIGLPQGLQMLQIFRSYPLVTSLLDDFEFYEQREKSLRARRSRLPAMRDSDMEFYNDSSSMKHLEAAGGKMNVTGNSRKPSNFLSSSPDTTRKLSVANPSQARN